ncbi:MAG: hypothetical protein N3A65_09190 [candidate division WOR-3 bacterium]|nr:hypothetical protein [candidate division WOR-3 bacterium]
MIRNGYRYRDLTTAFGLIKRLIITDGGERLIGVLDMIYPSVRR